MGQKPLRFTKADIIARAASVAKDLGVMLKLCTDGAILIYSDNDERVIDQDSDLNTELRAFEAKHGYS